MTPPPLVVDTNLVVSGVLTAFADAPTTRVLNGMLRGEFVFLLSQDLLVEYRAVMLRPAVRRYHKLADGHVDRILTELVANARVLEVASSGEASREDGHLLALLAVEPAAALVTGDRALGSQLRGRATVLSPRALAEILNV